MRNKNDIDVMEIVHERRGSSENSNQESDENENYIDEAKNK